MKVETWDSFTDETKIVNINNTNKANEIVKLADIALGNPIGAVEWDGISIHDETIVASNTDGSMATYKILR